MLVIAMRVQREERQMWDRVDAAAVWRTTSDGAGRPNPVSAILDPDVCSTWPNWTHVPALAQRTEAVSESASLVSGQDRC